MKAASPYLIAAEAARHLRFEHADGSLNLDAFRAFLYRRRKAGRSVPTHRRGTTLLFREADLDACLAEERPLRLLKVRA